MVLKNNVLLMRSKQVDLIHFVRLKRRIFVLASRFRLSKSIHPDRFTVKNSLRGYAPLSILQGFYILPKTITNSRIYKSYYIYIPWYIYFEVLKKNVLL